MKYCCDKLKALHSIPKKYGINFRIIKLSDIYINENKKRGIIIKKDELYNFILTEGYESEISNNTKKLFICYCPFCGESLKKIYCEDEFVNETNHAW